jgi:branched-chain amino acid transport system ATP-binding protein
MTAEAPALVLRAVSAGYGAVQVLREVSLEAGPAEIVAVLGANGAGKTTLLRAISGTVRGSGRIEMAGTLLTGRSPERIVAMGVAHVPQGRGTFPRLSVEENLQVGAIRRRDRDIRADIDRWYSVFPRLGERRGQQAGSLSGGEQQMLAVARAMMSRPKVLLLDEPSLGLAPNSTYQVVQRLSEINVADRTTMILVEQNARLALSIAHRAYVLEAGAIALTGPAHELGKDDRLRRAYLGI